MFYSGILSEYSSLTKAINMFYGKPKKAWHIRDHSGITFIQRNGRGSGKIQQLDNGRGVGGGIKI